jgi:antitoxin VapB
MPFEGIYQGIYQFYALASEAAMRRAVRLFKNGRSQAVRLPALFRFDSEEVFIHKDEQTGDVILSRKPGSWDEFFVLADSTKIPKDFLKRRDRRAPAKRMPF